MDYCGAHPRLHPISSMTRTGGPLQPLTQIIENVIEAIGCGLKREMMMAIYRAHQWRVDGWI